jgi:hypothetical protein
MTTAIIAEMTTNSLVPNSNTNPTETRARRMTALVHRPIGRIVRSFSARLSPSSPAFGRPRVPACTVQRFTLPLGGLERGNWY